MSEFQCEYCGKADFESAKALQGHLMTCKPRFEKARNERVPFHLQVRGTGAPDTDDGFRYRRFNDNWRHDPDRIRKAELAGYVKVDVPQSGRSVGTNEDGSEIKGVLMRIPKELYEEDQKIKHEELKKVDEQILRGKHTENANDRRYIPSGGINMESKLTP